MPKIEYNKYQRIKYVCQRQSPRQSDTLENIIRPAHESSSKEKASKREHAVPPLDSRKHKPTF